MPREKRWGYLPMVIDVAGVRFEVNSTGTVYQRQMIKPRKPGKDDSRKPGKDDSRKLGPDDLIAGPLTKVRDEETANAVRDLIRARERQASDLDDLMQKFIAARTPADPVKT